MEGDGKRPKHDTSIDQQESLPPLTHVELDIIEEADLSTGYKCLKFLMVNRFMRDRLGPLEHDWIYKTWRNQVITFTKMGSNKSPKKTESHEPNKRLQKEVEFELHMARVQKRSRLTATSQTFLQKCCERCFRRPSRKILCQTCDKQVGPGCCLAWELPGGIIKGKCLSCWTKERVPQVLKQVEDSRCPQ